MTQVDRITEDIAHMPVAAFIFSDKESDEVHYSTDFRYLFQIKIKLSLKLKNPVAHIPFHIDYIYQRRRHVVPSILIKSIIHFSSFDLDGLT